MTTRRVEGQDFLDAARSRGLCTRAHVGGYNQWVDTTRIVGESASDVASTVLCAMRSEGCEVRVYVYIDYCIYTLYRCSV